MHRREHRPPPGRLWPMAAATIAHRSGLEACSGPIPSDEFPEFGGYQPPAHRSEFDEFDDEDANSVLDGDLSPAESRALAARIRAGRWDRSESLPHGGHRSGTGWGKSEFPAGWAERDVCEWVCAIVDNPTRAEPDDQGFILSGAYRGVFGELRDSPVGRHSWAIGTAYPVGI